MIGPNEVVGISWAMAVLGVIALALSAHSCFRRPSLNRGILVGSCVFVTLADLSAVQMVKRYPFMAVRTAYIAGVTAYNIGLWTARVYVCNRMSTLTPSPSLSSAFNNIAYVAGAYGALLVAAYTSDAGAYYRTNPPNKPAISVLAVSVSGLFANLTFDAANVYLHFKSLRMFASSSAVRRKLYVMTLSTFASTVFSLARSVYQIQERTVPRLAMGTLEITLLPAAIILGEFAAVRIGRPLGSTTTSNNSRSEKGSVTKTAIGSEVTGGKDTRVPKEKTSVRQQAELTSS